MSLFSFSLWSPLSSLSPSSVAPTHLLIPERHEWSKKDAEMTEREEREGGRTGFQGAASSRSTQTDAVEQRWLEKKEQGQCVCVCVCWGRVGRGVKL